MTKAMNLDANAVWNGILRPVDGAQQKLTVGAASVQSVALKTGINVLFSTTDCWVRFATNPTAVANDGNSVFIPSYTFRTFSATIGDKVAVIQDSTGGFLHVCGGA